MDISWNYCGEVQSKQQNHGNQHFQDKFIWIQKIIRKIHGRKFQRLLNAKTTKFYDSGNPWKWAEGKCILAILMLVPNICFWPLVQLGCWGHRHLGPSPLFLFFSLISLQSTSQCFSNFPRYLALGKSSSQTHLPHCHFNKLASYTCWPPQILPFKHSSIPSTLFCHACAEGWDSNISSSSCWCFHFLFPSCCLISGGAHCSALSFCLYMVLHWGTPCCKMLWKLRVLVGS